MVRFAFADFASSKQSRDDYFSGFLNDLHLFDPANSAWTDLSSNTQGPVPAARRSMGFVSDGAGKLYVFAGKTIAGRSE